MILCPPTILKHPERHYFLTILLSDHYQQDPDYNVNQSWCFVKYGVHITNAALPWCSRFDLANMGSRNCQQLMRKALPLDLRTGVSATLSLLKNRAVLCRFSQAIHRIKWQLLKCTRVSVKTTVWTSDKQPIGFTLRIASIRPTHWLHAMMNW